MTHDMDALRAASERSGVSFDYLRRLASADEYDPKDPGGGNVLAKQITVMFDHYAAKCLTEDNPIDALRRFGFEEMADALEGRISGQAGPHAA